jgi:hypothetical protein
MISFEYATVSEAVNDLMEKGYKTDFNLPENVSKFETGEFSPSDFRIVGVYRYEGETDPADEAVVYAIESKGGLKGLLVSGYGSAAGRGPASILKKLRHYVP